MLQELDDEDFVTELVSAFLEECKEATEQCQKAKDAKNLDEVRSAAHGLKGSAAIFGADSLSETAKTLEFAIKVRWRRPAAGAAAPPPIACRDGAGPGRVRAARCARTAAHVLPSRWEIANCRCFPLRWCRMRCRVCPYDRLTASARSARRRVGRLTT